MKKIALTGKNGIGNFALVDDDVFDFISKYSWMVGKDIYARRGQKIKGTRKSITKYMHRDIILFYEGNIPINSQIDHINMDRLDNRRSNLRVATRSQNHMNMNKNFNNKSGYKGVFLDKKSNRWFGNIKINQKNIYLGTFDNKLDAALAYNQAAQKYFGEFARLNDILTINA